MSKNIPTQPNLLISSIYFTWRNFTQAMCTASKKHSMIILEKKFQGNVSQSKIMTCKNTENRLLATSIAVNY